MAQSTGKPLEGYYEKRSRCVRKIENRLNKLFRLTAEGYEGLDDQIRRAERQLAKWGVRNK